MRPHDQHRLWQHCWGQRRRLMGLKRQLLLLREHPSPQRLERILLELDQAIAVGEHLQERCP